MTTDGNKKGSGGGKAWTVYAKVLADRPEWPRIGTYTTRVEAEEVATKAFRAGFPVAMVEEEV